MLKRDITYTNFDDEEVTETFFFNISKPEMVDLQAEKKGGFAEWLQSILKMEDTQEILNQFKRIILMAYGEKSPDGRFFIKKDEDGKPLSRNFEQSAAYISLYMEMITDEGKAAEFINAIFPQDLMAQAAEAAKASKTPEISKITPPTPPAPPQR